MATEDVQVADDAVDSAWAEGIKELGQTPPPPDNGAEQTEQPAPSSEGVVVSGVDEPKPTEPAKQEEPKKEEQQKPLGGLSTDELLERLKSQPSDPDTYRALEIRLKRLDSQAKPRRERNQNAQAAMQAATEVQAAIKGLNDDYPELATRLAPVGKLAEVVTKPIVEAEDAAQREADEALVESAFPGFNALRVPNGPLAQWLKAQPQSVQEQASLGGVAGAMEVLEKYEQHVIATGKPSPFAPQQKSAPAPAAPDPKELADRIRADREKRLKAATAIPQTAVKPAPTQETTLAAAWNEGVNEVANERRFQR
ncbi:MAG: hypothetical protein E6R03_07415 [Hyphomicrobiaceae bacterium]|nr:MAG: hypothetical protein E6R03_07415 [Hyphomicrobiaceae bacterium]